MCEVSSPARGSFSQEKAKSSIREVWKAREIPPLPQCWLVWKLRSLPFERREAPIAHARGCHALRPGKWGEAQASRKALRHLRNKHKHWGNSSKQEKATGGRGGVAGFELSPHSDGSIATAVGVVDNSIEGLIHPLPEHHGWGLPEGKKTLTSAPLHGVPHPQIPDNATPEVMPKPSGGAQLRTLGLALVTPARPSPPAPLTQPQTLSLGWGVGA